MAANELAATGLVEGSGLKRSPGWGRFAIAMLRTGSWILFAPIQLRCKALKTFGRDQALK
jgi:hypothetical protein